MKLRFIGKTFGGGVLGLTNGKVYECIGIELGLLRIIDDEGEDYIYSPITPGPANGSSPPGRWEIVEDDEAGTLAKLISSRPKKQ